MKLYCLDISFNEIKINDIYKHLIFSKEYKLIISDSGMYKITNYNLCKIVPCDNITSRFNIKFNNKDYEFICDKSKYNIQYNISQIPYNHIELNIQEKEYKINNKSLLSLIILYINHSIHDIYFITRDNINLSEINDDMITFLSLIKNI